MATNNSIDNKITSGNFTVTAGNVVITAGNATLPTTNTTGTQGVIKFNSTIWAHVGGNATDGVYIGNNAGKINSSNTLPGWVAIGAEAAANIDTTGGGIAIGYQCMKATSGTGNCARNVAIGHQALMVSNTNTDSNVVIGHTAYSSSTGRPLGCTLMGYGVANSASINGNFNYNIIFGHNAGTSLTGTDSNNIIICHSGTSGDNNTIRIGTTGSSDKQQDKCYIAGIYGVTPGGTKNIAYVDSNGQLGSVASVGVANGGTGLATLTAHALYVGNGTSAPTALAVGATGEILVGATSADCAWSASPTVTTMYATTFDTNVAAAGVTLSGTTLAADGSNTDINITITPKGAGTIVSSAVYSKQVTSNVRTLLVDDGGLIGNATSSLRFKNDVKDMGDDSSAIYKLRPVTFTYKADDKKKKQYGLIAEEVDKVMPLLVSYDEDGKPHSVSYHDLPQILLNEVIKMRKEIDDLKAQLKGK